MASPRRSWYRFDSLLFSSCRLVSLFGPSRPFLGAFWGALGVIFGLLGAYFRAVGSFWGSFFYVLRLCSLVAFRLFGVRPSVLAFRFVDVSFCLFLFNDVRQVVQGCAQCVMNTVERTSFSSMFACGCSICELYIFAFRLVDAHLRSGPADCALRD